MEMFGKLAGSFDKDQIRFNRIKEILQNNPDENEEMKAEDVTMEKDDAKFIQLHLENSCPKYHMYFGDYNTEMFQKLCPSMWYKQYDKDDKIFERDDKWKWFYFILKGTVHVLEPTDRDNPKIANLHHENEVFGLKKKTHEGEVPARNRDAVAETPTSILMIDAQEYENIRKQRVLSAAETKIEFLTRYIPRLRAVDSKIVEELEIMFQKEKVTKGYRLLEQGKLNDYLYFILSGECRILYNYNSNKKLKSKFDSLDESIPGFLLIGKLSTGEWFGQTSAVNQQKWKYSVQAASDEVVVYKILWTTFYENFGKDSGAPVQYLRAKAVMDNNWVNTIIK